MRALKFFRGEYYHIYNRGVEKREVFLDGADYFRFILGMREFNDMESISNIYRLQDASIVKDTKEKKPLVKFICYCLMPNHFHFLVQQIEDDGVSKFMQKLGTGYTKYFNKRYERSGVLFQGVFKAKHVLNDEYLLHLSRYIHLNPLSTIELDWLSKGIRNKDKTFCFLREYKWHSLPFYFEDKSNLIKLYSDIILGQFKTKEYYKEFLLDWVGSNLEKIKEIIIED